jgi:hypothetical protein
MTFIWLRQAIRSSLPVGRDNPLNAAAGGNNKQG